MLHEVIVETYGEWCRRCTAVVVWESWGLNPPPQTRRFPFKSLQDHSISSMTLNPSALFLPNLPHLASVWLKDFGGKWEYVNYLEQRWIACWIWGTGKKTTLKNTLSTLWRQKGPYIQLSLSPTPVVCLKCLICGHSLESCFVDFFWEAGKPLSPPLLGQRVLISVTQLLQHW